MIYIVEDDPEIREMETYALQSAGFEVKSAENGKGLDNLLKINNPDLFILDIMLPGDDGLVILKRLRTMESTQDIPVMMLTAKGAELDKVRGLDLGADDYMTKPFGILEFISRVKALLRRSSNKTTKNTTSFSLGKIIIDDSERTVTVCGERIELTFKEYELLKMLASNPGQVFARSQIMENVWGTEASMETRTIDMHIKTLRQKLGTEGELIQTVRNVGYKAKKE